MPSPPPESGAPAPSTCRNERILLVGEDVEFRSGLAGNLRDDGHEVLEVSSPLVMPPLGALEGVAVVITEDVMSGETGRTLAARLHAIHPALPVVVLTNYPVRTENEGARGPIVHTLEKPIDYGPLHELIHALAEGPKTEPGPGTM